MGLDDDILNAATDAATDALLVAASAVLQKAQANVPVGDPDVDPDPSVSLRESGRVERDGLGYVVIFDTAYAAKVHEDLRLKHPRGGSAKYLERAVTEVAPTLDDIIAGKVHSKLAGSSRATRTIGGP